MDQELRYFSPLKDWALYQEVYTRHTVPPANKNAAQKALLIGSLSALSSAAFAAFSQDVIGAQPYIVDMRASVAKRRHGTFVQGNGLTLPNEWSNSMQLVETNSLLPLLLDTKGQLRNGPRVAQKALRALLHQALRVLAPGGCLLMCEYPPRFDFEDIPCKTPQNRRLVASFVDTLHIELEKIGFSDIAIEEGWTFSSTDYLFDSARRFDAYERTTVPRFRTIYARKAEE